MSVLTDRASLLDEFFRLVNTDASDDDLIEHDSATGDSYYQLLQAGYHDAQDYLIGAGVTSRWAKTSSALTFTGTFPNRYVALPSDFLRLDGDERRTGLRDGKRSWGRQVPYHRRFEIIGNGFYFRGNEGADGLEGDWRLYLTDGASPPAGLVADYIYRVGTLADDDTVDFPAEDRQLIVAFAAVRAMRQSWYVGGPEEKQDLVANLEGLKRTAFRRQRPSREPRSVGVRPLVHDRLIL